MQINLRFWDMEGLHLPHPRLPATPRSLLSLVNIALRVLRYALCAYERGRKIDIYSSKKHLPPVRPALLGSVDPHIPGVFGICAVGYAHRLFIYKKESPPHAGVVLREKDKYFYDSFWHKASKAFLKSRKYCSMKKEYCLLANPIPIVLSEDERIAMTQSCFT